MVTRNAVFDGKTLCVETGATSGGASVSELNKVIILPGFCDVHVHFREPGFSYKETMGPKRGTFKSFLREVKGPFCVR